MSVPALLHRDVFGLFCPHVVHPLSMQAFGVGALEEEDDDIYVTDSLCNYDQSMEMDDTEQLFGWTAPNVHKGGNQRGECHCSAFPFHDVCAQDGLFTGRPLSLIRHYTKYANVIGFSSTL